MATTASVSPEIALECLVRQLSEVELLESMFPDECSVDSCVATAAALAQQAEEAGELRLEAGASLSPLTFTITVKLDFEGEPELRLGFTLPQLYPRTAPLIVAGMTTLGRKQREELAATLVATAKEHTDQQGEDGEDGEECICELVQQAQELAVEMLATQAEAGAAAEAGDSEGANALTQCVVKIDHMNDSKNYMKALKKWCEQLGLAARVFYREAGTAKASGRVEAVLVVLEGPDDAVGGWLTRLRSEYVDVDGRGGKCKERKSTVMCRREVSNSAPATARLTGWEASVYEEEGTMETALANMDLLHVGLGSTRWGGAAGSVENSASAEPVPDLLEQSDVASHVVAPAYLEQIGVGSVMNRVHLSVEVSTGKQQTVLTNAQELRQRRTAVTAAQFDVAAQPRNGAANKELCGHLATALGVKSGDVTVASGHKTREKVIAVEGLPLVEVEKRLLDAA